MEIVQTRYRLQEPFNSSCIISGLNLGCVVLVQACLMLSTKQPASRHYYEIMSKKTMWSRLSWKDPKSGSLSRWKSCILNVEDGLMVEVQVSSAVWGSSGYMWAVSGRQPPPPPAAAATVSPSSASARWQLPTCTELKTQSQAPV